MYIYVCKNVLIRINKIRKFKNITIISHSHIKIYEDFSSVIIDCTNKLWFFRGLWWTFEVLRLFYLGQFTSDLYVIQILHLTQFRKGHDKCFNSSRQRWYDSRLIKILICQIVRNGFKNWCYYPIIDRDSKVRQENNLHHFVMSRQLRYELMSYMFSSNSEYVKNLSGRICNIWILIEICIETYEDFNLIHKRKYYN